MANPATPPTLRTTAEILPGVATPEGEGITVYRPIPSRAAREIDPFLLLDRLGPVAIEAGRASGFPPHPHAGFEVVSYVLQGGLEHRDSAGNRGRLGPGDVQWMTTGRGIVHSEMPGETLRTEGGTLEAIQLWINLNARDKQMEPRYGDIPAADLPVAISADGRSRVRIIAGEALGQAATLPLMTPITYQHWTLSPGATIDQPLPDGTEALAYVLSGEGRIGADGRPVGRDELVRFEEHRGAIRLVVPADGERTEVLLLAGPPTGEPVARSGPFVMNTMTEIREVIARFKSGGLGAVPE